MPKMKRDTLEHLLAQQQHVAVGALNGTIGKHRSNLLDRYNAEPYGDEVSDRSSVVDSSVRDTIESIKPELMDIFFGGDDVVEFTPQGPEDVDGAKQETQVVDHVFTQMNDGFMVLYNWFTDALLLKNGYVKRYWDERKHIDIEEYDELSPEEAANLVAEIESTSDEVEFLARSGGIDEEAGTIEPLYLKIKRTKTEKRYRVESVPPEEVLVSPQWARVDFNQCPFHAHKRQITISDLVAMGFNRKQVEDLPDFDGRLDTEEAENRFTGEFFDESGLAHSPDTSMREVLVYENYIMADYDGDGIAELLQVFTAGERGEILKRDGKYAIEQVSHSPLEALCPLPIPHKHYGLSVGELVIDLARIKTVLQRQMLDNTVQANNPDLIVDENRMTAKTTQDLQVTQAGGRVIRVEGGTDAISPLPHQSLIGESLTALEYIDALRESRTGVVRGNQGIDPDSLGPLAQDTVKNLMTAAQKRILLIARIFAETGVKSLFMNMHRDLRNGPWKEIALELNEEFVAVNPRLWRNRTDMTVNVGLGTGDRDVQFGRLNMILQKQEQGMEAGLVGYKHIHHTLNKMVELSGFKDTSNFFPTPREVAEDAQNRPEQPDPAMIMMQMERDKAANERAAKEAELEIKRIDAQTKRLDVLMKDDRERDLKEAELANNAAIAQDRDVAQ